MVDVMPEPTAPPPVNILLRPIAADANPEQEFDGEVPFEFLCPITNKIMKDPVTASDGYDYERQAIRRWFRRKRTSPVSNEELTDLTFRANGELRNRICVFMGEHSSVSQWDLKDESLWWRMSSQWQVHGKINGKCQAASCHKNINFLLS